MSRVTRSVAAALALALGAAACTVKETEAPPLAGPSGMALSLQMTASPDVLSRDGVSQSALQIAALGPDGRAARAISLRMEVVVANVVQDLGTLSSHSVVTGDDGIARLTYTAPQRSADPSDAGTTIQIRATPVGTDFGGTTPREISMRLTPPGSDEVSTIEPVRKRLEIYPTLRFKLDPTNDWTDELIEQLVETGAVDSLDLKGQYKGTPVDVETDPGLYRKLIDAFPDAWLEDPDVNDETKPILDPVADRVTWDAPIHSVADITSQPWPPKMVNIKPSRFGPLHALFAAYDHCDENGIGAYGGGQWELGPGRGHIQYLASLFHPDTPNDVAPSGYNTAGTEPGLPSSPLEPMPTETGFRWGE